MDLLIIIFLTLLNGIFAMSELAIASSRKARLEAMSAAGDAGAASALSLMANPTQFLSTVQVGITSIGVLNGIVGEAAFSPIVAEWLRGLGTPESVSSVLATTLVVAVITFTTIIFGELVPKRIGQLYPEAVSRWISRPMAGLARLTKPFVYLLSTTTQAVLRMLPIDTTVTHRVTEEELVASLEEGVDAGLIEEQEHRLVQNVLGLDDRLLSSIMVPRSDIVWLEADMTAAQALERLTAGATPEKFVHAHSWYPVCKDGELDHVVGVVSTGRILQVVRTERERPLESFSKPAIFVPETLTGMELLEQYRSHVGRMVFVVDEYGEIQGLLTPRDLLEAITGELQPALHEEAWALPQVDGSWKLDGMIPASELKARLDIEDLPSEDKAHYNTLAGLLMFVSGSLPVEGQVISCAGWDFEVLKLVGKRVEWVMARQTPETN